MTCVTDQRDFRDSPATVGLRQFGRFDLQHRLGSGPAASRWNADRIESHARCQDVDDSVVRRAGRSLPPQVRCGMGTARPERVASIWMVMGKTRLAGVGLVVAGLAASFPPWLSMFTARSQHGEIPIHKWQVAVFAFGVWLTGWGSRCSC